jgi:hypothetical protein
MLLQSPLRWAFYLSKYNMTTPFANPRTIAQVDIPNTITGRNSIPWSHSEDIISATAYAVTTAPLHTISGFWQEKFLAETSQLWTTNYGFTDTLQTVTGIELAVNVQRLARIQDSVIQLTLNGEIIGDNLASTINPVQSDTYTSELLEPLHPLGDFNIYGGPTNMWGTELTSADVADATFGVVISFKSNIIIPHSDLVYLDQVALRITYA